MILFLLLAGQPAVTPPAVTDPLSRAWQVRAVDGGEMHYILPRPTDADYPVSALQQGLEGTTLLQLVVNPSGAILTCDILQSSGHSALDDGACRLYRKLGRFRFVGVSKPVTLRAPVTWRTEGYYEPAAVPEGK